MIMLSHTIVPLLKKKLAPIEEVKPSEGVEKVTNLLDSIDNNYCRK